MFSNYQVMPDLSDEDFWALKADIAARGVMVPVEYDEDGNVLDGHHRLRACEELGIENWPQLVRPGLTEDQKRAHARALNLARRHLTREQRQALIREQLVETPQKSDRQIAAGLGVSDKTVGAARKEMEDGAEIPHQATIVGKDGVTQPRTKAQKPSLWRSPYDDSVICSIDPPIFPLPSENNKTTLVTLHTGDEESYTPKEYVESARIVMGGIDLDPASNPQAQETVKALRYFTADTDGLAQAWSGRVWMNPPYTARVINRFVDKLLAHLADDDISQAIVLTNNNTDTSWFHAAANVAAAVCFTRGRINFLKPDDSRSSPTNGQSFFYFGNNLDEFVREFSKHGLVMVRA